MTEQLPENASKLSTAIVGGALGICLPIFAGALFYKNYSEQAKPAIECSYTDKTTRYNKMTQLTCYRNPNKTKAFGNESKTQLLEFFKQNNITEKTITKIQKSTVISPDKNSIQVDAPFTFDKKNEIELSLAKLLQK